MTNFHMVVKRTACLHNTDTRTGQLTARMEGLKYGSIRFVNLASAHRTGLLLSLKHDDIFASVANCRTEIPRDISGYICKILASFPDFYKFHLMWLALTPTAHLIFLTRLFFRGVLNC